MFNEKFNQRSVAAVYEFNGIHYEVSRAFAEAVPLRELLKREIAETIARTGYLNE